MEQEPINIDISRILAARDSGKRVVFTNGCFDILHVGHIRYLSDAKALGDFLVVGLNSDSSTSRLKGPERPLTPQSERRELLTALRSVDEVVIFEEDTPLRLVEIIRPDVLVKGGDWSVDKIVGGTFVQSYGGNVLSLPYHPGHSTTGILTRIKSL